MEQRPSWEANSFSASQEISHFLRNPKVQQDSTYPCYEPHRSCSRPPIHFLKIYFTIFLPSTPGSSKWSLSLGFLQQNSVCTYPVPTRVTCSAHLILPDFFTQIIFDEQHTSFSSSLTLSIPRGDL